MVEARPRQLLILAGCLDLLGLSVGLVLLVLVRGHLVARIWAPGMDDVTAVALDAHGSDTHPWESAVLHSAPGDFLQLDNRAGPGPADGANWWSTVNEVGMTSNWR